MNKNKFKNVMFILQDMVNLVFIIEQLQKVVFAKEILFGELNF